jgi:hypothetical protein
MKCLTFSISPKPYQVDIIPAFLSKVTGKINSKMTKKTEIWNLVFAI